MSYYFLIFIANSLNVCITPSDKIAIVVNTIITKVKKKNGSSPNYYGTGRGIGIGSLA